MSVLSRSKIILSACALAFLAAPALAGYAEGMECFKSANYDCTINEFNTEVQAHPEYDFGWFMIGVSSLQKKDYDNAIENFNRAIELNDKKLHYFLNKSKVYRRQEQFAKVIATLEGRDALSANAGETYELNFQLGTAYHQQSQHSSAIPYLEKAVAVKPDFATFYLLGISYDHAGDSDKSIATLKEALKQRPGDSDVQSQLATAYLGLAQRERNKPRKEQLYTEAVSHAQGSVRSDANDFRKQNTLGRACLGAGQYDCAEKAFKKALSINGRYCFAQANLGKVYIVTEHWNDAVKILLDATRCDSKSNVAWESLGFSQEKLYKDLSTEEAKIAQLEKALASFRKAAGIKSSASTSSSMDRIQNNIEIAEQNIRIAAGNIRTMEGNLKALERGIAEVDGHLAQLAKQRQFFLDKGQWSDEKEQEDLADKAVLERDRAELVKKRDMQQKELDDARAAANPA